MEQKESFYTTIFEKSPLPIIVIEKDTLKFLKVNPAVTSALGWNEDELLKMKFTDIIPEEGKEYLMEEIQKVDVEDIKLNLLNKTKNQKWIEMTVIATAVKFDEKECILKIATDISEQKRATALLEEQQVYFQNLFNRSPFAVLLLDTEEKVIQASKKFRELFKYSSDEAKGKTLKELIIPADYINEHNEITEKVKNGKYTQLETTRKTRDNTLINVFAVKFPIFLDKAFKGSYAFYLDISHELELKKELKKLYSELEQRVKQRTIELESAYKRLEEINEEFEEVNKTKDNFISIISHDLRNPIAAIVSSSEIMMKNLEELQKNELQNFTRIINSSSVKIVNQLNELVSLAKQKIRKIRFDPQTLNVFEFVSTAFELLKEIADKKDIRLQNNLDKRLWVNADPTLLRSILQNLVTNSLKFTPNEGLITITAHETSQAMVEIKIKDTGKGMTETEMNTLFSEESFVGKPKEENSKSGLGLILVKHFIEKHQGKIWVESEPAKGTTFYFTLPAGKPDIQRDTHLT